MSGCTTSDGSKPTKLPPISNSGSASTSSAPKLTADQEAIVGQYKAYFLAINDLVGAPENVVFATLIDYAYPAVIKHVYEALVGVAAEGNKASGTVNFAEMAPSVEGSTAKVEECRDTTTETIVSSTTGALVSRGSPGTRFRATLNHDTDGVWRITASTAGVDAC